MVSEGTRALARVSQHIGLVGKVLSAREDTFFKPIQIVLRCETTKGFEDFIVDVDVTELNLWAEDGDFITRLPTNIGQLKKLTKLSLYGNALTSLPVEIGQLKKLTKLSLYGNELTSLPVEIGQLKNLVELNLKNNKLLYLPKEIGQLTNLTSLGLSENKLKNDFLE